jgi:snRNA-activating protein complex subunit 1
MSSTNLTAIFRSSVSGVVTDFEALFAKFTATKSVRYEHFLEVWKEMCMSMIFAGRQNDRECREFTEECLKLVLPYCLPPYQFQVRVCGIYLLYALYFKYPFLPRVKIRVTLTEWRQLLSLISDVHEQKHLDVEYVFTRLRYDRAFHFVAVRMEMYPGVRDALVDSSSDVQQQKLEVLIDQKSIISELFESDTIDQLAAIHEEYHRVKCSLSSPNALRPEQSLNVIENGLVQLLTKAVTAHEDWRKSKVGKKLAGRRRRNSGGHTSESEAESEADSESTGWVPKSQGSIRAEIKARAFSSVGPTIGSRRYRKTVIDTDLVSNKTRSSPQKKGNSTSTPKRGQSQLIAVDPSETSWTADDNDNALDVSSPTVAMVSMPLLTAEETHDSNEDFEIHPAKAKKSTERKKIEKKMSKKVGRPRKNKSTPQRSANKSHDAEPRGDTSDRCDESSDEVVPKKGKLSSTTTASHEAMLSEGELLSNKPQPRKRGRPSKLLKHTKSDKVKERHSKSQKQLKLDDGVGESAADNFDALSPGEDQLLPMEQSSSTTVGHEDMLSEGEEVSKKPQPRKRGRPPKLSI